MTFAGPRRKAGSRAGGGSGKPGGGETGAEEEPGGGGTGRKRNRPKKPSEKTKKAVRRDTIRLFGTV